jgi:hypothetical protein
MTYTFKDLRKLRNNLLLATLLIAAGATALWWTRGQLKTATRDATSAASRYTEVENRLQRVRDEEAEIKAKSATFRELSRRGVIGPEKRLEWVELVSDIRRDMRLFAPDYEFAPQQSLGLEASGYQFVSSPMGLRLPLLHEGDLIGLLSQLQARAPALVLPRNCQIERQRPFGERPGIQPNLQAVCTLNWITINGSAKGRPK